MRTILLLSVGAIALLALAGAGAPPPDVPPQQEIVVTGHRYPIVVNGKAIRCRPLADDPQDLWRPRALPIRRHSALMPRSDGRGFELVDSDDADSKKIEPGIWRRVGTGTDQYVFRAPEDAELLCIGSKGKYPAGYAQLRQVVDATPFQGKRIRFTAWAASRDAARVDFWLASFDPYANQDSSRRYIGGPLIFNPGARVFGHGIIYNGGNSNGHDWHGSHGWTPVLIEIGPISKLATAISFGFVLNGSGDVWLYNPKLEAVAPGDPYRRKGDVFVIGSDRGSGQR